MADDDLQTLIARLNLGEVDAIDRLFREMEPALLMAVRRRLGDPLRAKLDSADVVQSVFVDVVSGVREGRFRFENRAQLMGLLRLIASRRIADRYAEHRPLLGRERRLPDIPSSELPRSAQPRPSEEAQGSEFWTRVLSACAPEHREVVRLRGAGLRIREIAKRCSLHEGSVRRILYDLARRLSVSPTSACDGRTSEG